MRNAHAQLTALVVGAGPTGLTLAAELARHGLRCRLVEKASARSIHSKALAVQARTLEVFDAMGVVKQVLAGGKRVSGLNVYVGRNQAAHLSLHGLESPYPFVLILEQSETERILEAQLTHMGVAVEREVELTTLRQEPDGVTAMLSCADGTAETVRSQWVIGCDGAHSAVRHLLGFPFEGAAYPEELWLADARLRWPLPLDELHVVWGRTGIFAAIPMPHGYHRLITWSEETTRGVAGELTLREVQTMADRLGPPGTVLSDPIWVSSFRIHRRIAPSMRHGRIFLVGDAAHIHSPAGGQGMNTGIQDAYNLAWKLALVAHGRSHPSLLDTYQAERHPVAAAVLRGTNVLTRLVLLRNPMLRALRNRLFPLVLNRPFVQRQARQAVSELAIHYRKSPIVGERWQGNSGPVSGDRAPDGALTSMTGVSARLFDLLRDPRHLLLLFEGHASVSEWERVIRLGSSLVRSHGHVMAVHGVVTNGKPATDRNWPGSLWIDPDRALHRRYGADQPCLYLIRPDGYIGFRSDTVDPQPVENYIRRIFVTAA